MTLLVVHGVLMTPLAKAADVVLPGTAWLEEVGCKSTNTHLYLMDKILDGPGETPMISNVRGAGFILRETVRKTTIQPMRALSLCG